MSENGRVNDTSGLEEGKGIKNKLIRIKEKVLNKLAINNCSIFIICKLIHKWVQKKVELLCEGFERGFN
jgi:hypothetical protein